MRILVECFADNLLITSMNFNCDYDHSGIGNISVRMQTKYSAEVVLGIVDNDRTKPKYFDKFEIIRSSPSVDFLKHRNVNDRFLIYINPDVEEFLYNAATEAGITGFTVKRMKRMTKDQNIAQNTVFLNYVKRIVAANPPSIDFLRGCINENMHL